MSEPILALDDVTSTYSVETTQPKISIASMKEFISNAIETRLASFINHGSIVHSEMMQDGDRFICNVTLRPTLSMITIKHDPYNRCNAPRCGRFRHHGVAYCKRHL